MKPKYYSFCAGFIIGMITIAIAVRLFPKDSNVLAKPETAKSNKITQDQKQNTANIESRMAELADAFGFQKNSEKRLRILKVLDDLSGHELESIFHSVDNMDLSAREKSSLKQDIIGKWAEVDPAHLAKYYSLLSPGKQSEIFGAIATSWAAYDPASALNWAFSLPKNPVSNTAAMVAAQSWSRSDPAAFSAWLATLPEESRINLVLGCANMRGDAADSQTWARILETIPNSEQKTRALQKIVSQWVALSPADALDYVKQISDKSISDKSASASLLSGVITGLSKTDPQLAFRTAMDIPASLDRDTLLLEVIATWGNTNPRNAAQEILGLEDGTGRNAMLGALANFWSMSDSQAASEWVQSLPRDSGVRDSVLSILATSLSKRQPALAAQTLLLIEDESIKAATEGKIRNK